MEKEIIERKIKEISNKIAKEYKPEKIILFGSWAWGEPRQDSDIDLFIVKKSEERRIERERQVQRLLLGTRLPIDVLVYTPEEVEKRLWLEDFFIKKIFQRGKHLYASS